MTPLDDLVDDIIIEVNTCTSELYGVERQRLEGTLCDLIDAYVMEVILSEDD